MIIISFPKIVKDVLKPLPKNDYPVLNTRLFFECWLSYALNLATGSPQNNFISFGHEHDYNFGKFMMSDLPPDAVGVMDRGFAGLRFIQHLVEENKYFVLRIKNNWKLEFDSENQKIKMGSSPQAQSYRVAILCDLETQTEFRLVTNLPRDGEVGVSDAEIQEIYRLRWGVELLWKFLKMHLKFDKLLTKNVNCITLQIYASLIAYLILQLVSIHEQWGSTLLDKFRYLQCCMYQKISYVHWFEEIVSC